MDQMAQEKPGEINRLLHDMMNYFRQGQLRPIRLARVSGASGTEIRETFLEMQQGKHIGKMVVELRDHTGQLRFGAIDCAKGADTVKLDGSASYLLQHKDFARELESMGCTVQFVQGSVTSAASVARAIDSTLGPLKGIIQMSMVLRDQAFLRMSLEDWDQATQPKVQGTWNLHNVSQSRHIALDFFVLFSSLSGIVGQSGQANYASANTFLDAFVRYRNSLKLSCTAIDLGMMESEEELFAVLEAAMAAPVQGSTGQQQSEALISSPSKYSNRVDYNSFILGISPTDNAQQKADVRFAVYHNTDGRGRGVSGSGGASSNDALRTLLAEGRKDPDVFGSDETIVFLATEIGRKLLALLLRSDEAVDVASRTAELGLDSLVAIEMRSWWKLVFGFDIIVLDMLSIGTLDAMGRRVADELLALHHK
ncbi:KR domain-containing protein [Xylaria longipes]|nr:KR domain-containing protein [Xylaria longipes]